MGKAATAWCIYCKRHTRSKHTSEAMKALLLGCIVSLQQYSAHEFGQLHNAMQGQAKLVTLFITYITCITNKTHVSDTTKHMFLLIELCPEVYDMMPHDITDEGFHVIVDAAIWANNNLYFEAKCGHTWSKKDKATDKITEMQE